MFAVFLFHELGCSARGDAMAGCLGFASRDRSVGSCFRFSRNSCRNVLCGRARRNERRRVNPDVSPEPHEASGMSCMRQRDLCYRCNQYCFHS